MAGYADPIRRHPSQSEPGAASAGHTVQGHLDGAAVSVTRTGRGGQRPRPGAEVLKDCSERRAECVRGAGPGVAEQVRIRPGRCTRR
jgi:hypothetical protein